jgi:hypothetical protein
MNYINRLSDSLWKYRASDAWLFTILARTAALHNHLETHKQSLRFKLQQKSFSATSFSFIPTQTLPNLARRRRFENNVGQRLNSSLFVSKPNLRHPTKSLQVSVVALNTRNKFFDNHSLPTAIHVSKGLI